MRCSLCNSTTRDFKILKDRAYVQCTVCKAILLKPEYHLSPQAEKLRYSLHNNDVDNRGYIEFVKPLIDSIKSDFEKDRLGLDFGCGTGPVITSQLKKSDYKINLYDPYFKPDKEVLNNRYDFIICCEVMEHFQDPKKEFQFLHSLLKPGGKLYCKTELWDEKIDFQTWHYKNDLTHVIFYNVDTLHWLQDHMKFSDLEIASDHFIFTA